jgi:hypothetical protein
MGASMNGRDYVQWHGFYEVAKIFYSDFLPEAEHLLPRDLRGEGKQLPPVVENQRGIQRSARWIDTYLESPQDITESRGTVDF